MKWNYSGGSTKWNLTLPPDVLRDHKGQITWPQDLRCMLLSGINTGIMGSNSIWASRQVLLYVGHPFGFHGLSLIFADWQSVRLPLWREDGSVIVSAVTPRSEPRRTYNHTFPIICDSGPLGQVGPVITPSTGIPFRRLLWLAGIRWKYAWAYFLPCIGPIPRPRGPTN
jgi:hypothetical protein